jgi:hypothetical protein
MVSEAYGRANGADAEVARERRSQVAGTTLAILERVEACGKYRDQKAASVMFLRGEGVHR